MRLDLGISELYVDIMLTLVVISVSGAFITLLNDLNRPYDDVVSVGKPPLALVVGYGGRNYLLIVNYEEEPKEVLLIINNVRVGSYVIQPQEVLVLNVDDVGNEGLYVLVGNYLVRPNYVDIIR
ncbi:MAG: hypothetical protein QW339_06260 [Sulfolobales archaeon]